METIESALYALTSVLEPAVVAVLGAFMALFMIAAFLPLYQLAAKLGM